MVSIVSKDAVVFNLVLKAKSHIGDFRLLVLFSVDFIKVDVHLLVIHVQVDVILETE